MMDMKLDIDMLVEYGKRGLKKRIRELEAENKRLKEQNAKLEEKLKAITCAECGKDMLECTCEITDTQLNL